MLLYILIYNNVILVILKKLGVAFVMRYFTRDRYEKMQVRGRFPIRTDDKEKWIKQLKEFCSECHVKDKEFDAWVFKHIPEVKDDILQGKKFTDKEVSEKLYIRIKEMANDWETAFKMYKAEYEDIKHKLPLSMRELRNYAFHDDIVLSLKKDSNNMINIELQRYSLKFINVREFETADDIIGDVWLFDEVHLSDIGNFDFQVLLYSPQGFLILHEFRVIADDILIEIKRY